MTEEQKARDMLERMGVENAQSFSAGELVELANLIGEKSTLDMRYHHECMLHDAKKAECLRLDKLLRECEEREEYVPFHTETISVIVNIAVYGLVFAAALKYLFWN